MIYEYNDGTKDRVLDPVSTMHELLNLVDLEAQAAIYDTLTTRAEKGELNQEEQIKYLGAIKEIAKATRKAFKLKNLSKRGDKVSGVTDGEALAMCFDFLAWLDNLKKKQGI